MSDKLPPSTATTASFRSSDPAMALQFELPPASSFQLTPPSSERYSLPPVTPANKRLPSADMATVDQFRFVPAAVLAAQVAPPSADIQIEPWTSVATCFTPSRLAATEVHKRGLATEVQFVPLSAEV